MHLQIDVTATGGYTVVSPQGEIDFATGPQLKDAITELLVAGEVNLVVDLLGVDFIESTGLGALIGGRRRAHALKGSLVLVCTEDQMLKIFRITGLDKVFAIHDTVEARPSQRPPVAALRRYSDVEPLAEAARLRRPGVVPEVLDRLVARSTVQRIASGCSVPVSSTITSAPAARAVCLQVVRARRGPRPRRRAAGATYIRLISAADACRPSACTSGRSRQPPIATGTSSRYPTKNAPRGGVEHRRVQRGLVRAAVAARRTPPAPRATSRCASGWVNATCATCS